MDWTISNFQHQTLRAAPIACVTVPMFPTIQMAPKLTYKG